MDLSNIRIKEHFGLITNDTNTSRFNFLVSPPKNRESIEKQDIVCLDHPLYGESCQILAEVKEMANYEEVTGSTVGNRIGKLLATTQIIGYIDLKNEDKPLRKLLVPPNPGSRIYVPYASFLEDAFSRDAQGKTFKQSLKIGKTEIIAASKEAVDQQINFYMDGFELTTKNTLISALDGLGKTYTATVIAEEIANKTNYPIVIIDPNNEYSSINSAVSPSSSLPFNFQTALINSNVAKSSQDWITKKIKQSYVTIITAENFTVAEKNEYYTNILNALAKSRREKNAPPFLLVVEEAENVSLQAMEEILGTKNGISTMLVASHPTLLGGKVLSTMQNQIIGRTCDPQDLAYLKNVVAFADEQLPSLGIGEWIINGSNITRPTKIHVRERYSKGK
ncbi:MAG TPA: DUF87 domain-containing protein [Candidatus Acidoferrum sp.]|nr:DUF87 domain-containing protein [Candidatus Acidoferrum sp.]